MSRPGAPGSLFLDEAEVSAIVGRLGAEIGHDHPDGVVLVGLLKGSVCFVADLARRIPAPCSMDFLALLPYGSHGQRVALSKDIEVDVTGKDVVLAVDIVDRGLTVNYVRRLLGDRGARSIDVCALFDRTERRLLPIELRYVGMTIGDEYLVGYGLDIEERHRNLPGLHVIDPASGV